MDTQSKLIELKRLTQLLNAAIVASDLVAIRVYSKRVASVAKAIKDTDTAA